MKKKRNGCYPCVRKKFTKTVRVMKLTTLLIMMGIMQLSANVFSQQTNINLKLNNVSVEQAIDALEELSNYDFFFSEKEVKLEKKISIDFANPTLEEIVAKVFGERFKYQITKNIVIISPKTTSKDAFIHSQKTIKGQVTDKKGNPLPGVSVVIKGTNIGVSTDIDGKFSIEIQKQEDIVLMFSFVGMETKEVKLDKINDLKVVLEESASELDEVIVTGYQKISKQRMTGSVETVTADKIADKGYLSVEEAIKGQMTGVSAVNLSGRPGAAAQIRIRGVNSLTGNSDPIWIVDGMPLQGDVPDLGVGGSEFTNSVLTNGIGNISVDEIESITVLKDAAASAIYGSRAANGVIVITTKRGRAGKSYINLRSNFSVNEAPENNLDLMNTEQKIAFEESLYNDFPYQRVYGRIHKLLRDRAAAVISDDVYQAERNKLKGINTDWFDKIFKTAYSKNHFISMQGGNEKTQFFASLKYLNETGVVPNNEYSNYGGSLKLTHDFNEKLRINLDMNVTYKEDQSTASLVNPIEYATYANPYEKPYDENGNVVYDRSYEYLPSSIKAGYKFDLNLLEDLNNNTNTSNYLNAGINFKLEYEFLKGLMFTTHASLSGSYTNARTVMLPGTYSSEKMSWIKSIYSEQEIPDNMNNGYLRDKNTKTLNYTWRNTLSFNKYLKEDHFVNFMMGQEISSTDSRNFFNVSPEYNPIYDLTGVPDLQNIEGSLLNVRRLGGNGSYERKSASFFATGTYSYKDTYVINFSGRLDGVDIIGTDNRFTPLWHTSFKYNIHNEDYMRAFEWINILSFRASYGFTGSIDHNAKPLPVIYFTDGGRRWEDIITPTDIELANPSVKWQKKQDRGFGLDYSLFNNRINGSVNYYNNVTKDLLDNKLVPISSGRNYIKANVASLSNEGLEFSFNTVNISSNDFRWTTNFNITFNKNKVIDTYYNDIEDLPTMLRSMSNQRYFVKDMPTLAWYGYKFAGVDPATGHMLAYIDANDDDGNPIGHKLANGKYVIDMDTEYRKEAIEFLGDAYPVYTGGFGTSFSYKRLSLKALFTYMAGHKIKSFRADNGNSLFAARLNSNVNALNRWRKPGDVTDVGGYTRDSENAYYTYFFDTELEDGGFVKLSNVSLVYNLPIELCRKLKLARLTLGLNANNLYTWTKYKGIDPENMGAFGYPSARRYSINLNIGI